MRILLEIDLDDLKTAREYLDSLSERLVGGQKSSNEVEVIPSPMVEEKIDSSEVFALAKNLAKTHGVDKIKSIISKYGAKMSDIDEADIPAFYNDLKDL